MPLSYYAAQWTVPKLILFMQSGSALKSLKRMSRIFLLPETTAKLIALFPALGS